MGADRAASPAAGYLYTAKHITPGSIEPLRHQPPFCTIRVSRNNLIRDYQKVLVENFLRLALARVFPAMKIAGTGRIS